MLIEGNQFLGLRIVDIDGADVINHVWYQFEEQVGTWTAKNVPVGEEVIGFEVNRNTEDNTISQISFQTWSPVEEDDTGFLR